MNKKFLSVILFSALMVGTAGTFTSCKDYDDDIKDLQGQLDKKASLDELNAKVATLQTAVDEAKATANEAKTKAQEALDKAGSGSGVSEADLTALKAELEAQIAKLASLEAVDTKIAALKTELEGSITDAVLKTLSTKVDALSAEIMSLIGHRLTSLAVIPTTHINGIAAITLTTLQYTPQKYQAMAKHTSDPAAHTTRPVLDHVNAATAPNSISTEYNEAYFHVSPSVGVRTQDIELPSFDCIQSENIMTKASGATVTANSPVKPVTYDINKDVLTVKFKKTVKGSIAAQGGHSTGKETFYMASLKAPIAVANYTDAEKKAYDEKGTKVYVNSEYVRLHEEIKVPYLTNSRTDFTKHNDLFADETQTDANGTFYVHYHDSVCVYESKANELIDVKWAYDQPLDLKTLVQVCVTDVADANKTHKNHAKLANYKDYGLDFRFYIPSAPYITLGGSEGNTNKTDQQKFAQLDSHENGILSSKVYSLDGVSATAVGREPIVRVELIDVNNKALVALRYIKIKWVKETGERPINHAFADSIYTCNNYMARIGTQEMNEVIYAQAKEGGMTKQEFHAVYVDGGFDGAAGTGRGEGTADIIKNNESGVDSYNIVWKLSHKDIVTKYPNWNKQEKMDFSKVCYWKDPSGAYPTLKITLTRTIYKPVFNLWGYDGRYWKNDNKWTTFNVNPIVYDTQESNPAWAANTKNNPTCNIYTDLLNGFLDDMGVKPTIGAGGAIWYADQARAGKKFYYSALYPNVASGFLGVKNNGYAEEGARFVFDKDKLEAANTAYKYNYFNGTSVVEKTATVSADGTILYIDGKKAAEIVNFTDNLLKAGEKTYNIKLEEVNPTHAPRTGDAPTEAAKAIVGEYVPIKLVADICYGDACSAYPILSAAHTATIKEYDAFIIEPLTVTTGTTENFTDATVGGSTIDVKGAFTYVSWNADKDGKNYIVSNSAGATALQKALWEFYEVQPGEWMTSQIKSNLKLVDGNLVPTAGVTNGPLPSNTTVVYDGTNETLTYNNYSGTPVNWDYELYIPVKFGYKWKTFTMTFKVIVKKNAGTPAQR
ncbi:hypothetical protein AAE250_23240 [Bacteroides sp. GD17]|jgi:hypothetical protein|uniref:hypothetical protein n=1 Tax=Bacteroides sp. GD17 TaxID=3139826 RepID=UPI00313BCF2C